MMTPAALREPFFGAWRLRRYEYRRADGKLTLPFGEDPVGLLLYDALGHMAGQLMQPDRPPFRKNSITAGTVEEVRAAFEGYIAYYGTYDVDVQAGTVIHHVTASWFPNFVGTDQVRHYEFQENRLLLRTPPRESGTEKRTGLLVWERISETAR
jgi:hypothetical protein